MRDTRARIWMRRLNTEGCFKPPTLSELKDKDNANFWMRWFKPYLYTKDLESSAYQKEKDAERRGQLSDLAPVKFPDMTDSEHESDLNQQLSLGNAKAQIKAGISRFLWDCVVDPDGI